MNFREFRQVDSRRGRVLLSQVVVFFQKELCPSVIHPRATLKCPEKRKENELTIKQRHAITQVAFYEHDSIESLALRMKWGLG